MRNGIVVFGEGVPSHPKIASAVLPLALDLVEESKAKQTPGPCRTHIFFHRGVKLGKTEDLPVTLKEMDESHRDNLYGQNPPSTLEISEAAVTWAIKKHINTLYVVTSKDQMGRCTRHLKQVLQKKEKDTERITLVLYGVEISCDEWQGISRKRFSSMRDFFLSLLHRITSNRYSYSPRSNPVS